jgi:hypothetical protein
MESNESFVIPCLAPESQTWGAACGSLNTVVLPITVAFAIRSDLTDAEWALVEPMIPPAKRGGRRREVNVREPYAGARALMARPWSARCYGVARQREGSRQNSIEQGDC